MKKFTFTLFFATFATAIFSQTWLPVNYGFTLSPSSANLGIGGNPLPSTKLFINQEDSTSWSGLFLKNSHNSQQYGGVCGVYMETEILNRNVSGFIHGLMSNVNHYGTGNMYGSLLAVSNRNIANEGSVYGNYVSCTNEGIGGSVFGVYSYVCGGSANKRYSGFFTGGKFVVINGNVGIGTENPTEKLDVVGTIKAEGLKVIGGNVGIGTTNPQYPLDVVGTIKTDELRVMNGNVGIGTTNPTVKLDVIGHIRAEEVRVCLQQGCDFVFDKDYKLMPLQDLSSFITENKHLPEIAPAAVMESEGINLSEMNAKLLQKVEELTLYVIDLQKQIDNLKK